MLEPPEEMPYLNSVLLEHWRDRGKSVFLTDSTAQSAERTYHKLAYQIHTAQVQYSREGRRTLRRELSLNIGVVLVAASGEVLHADTCQGAFEDTLHRHEVVKRESAAFPETVGMVPASRWPRRYLEPVMLIAVSALTAVLFFHLRSASPDGS